MLPVVGAFYLYNTIPTLIFTVLLIMLLAYLTKRSLEKSQRTDMVPRGIGNAMEAFFELIYNLTEGSAGPKYAPMIFPWFATIMFYVLFANLLKLSRASNRSDCWCQLTAKAMPLERCSAA